MRSTPKTLIPAIALSLTLAACGSSSSGSSSSSQASTATTGASTAATGTTSASSAVVKTASNAKLGSTVLVDARGMTLYRLSGEQNGKFICTSAGCVGAWHPLIASAGGVSGAGIASLGTVKRPDGTEQVAYNGEPLYTFTGDKAPGEANGEGIKDVGTWNAVSPSAGASGASATQPTSTAAPASPAGSGGGGYGY
jgi:predicted lipoprotein with Yx(FWY)xxD motif